MSDYEQIKNIYIHRLPSAELLPESMITNKFEFRLSIYVPSISLGKKKRVLTENKPT
jgi:hypothetical protein